VAALLEETAPHIGDAGESEAADGGEDTPPKPN
jgi:hypothetical protein